MVTQIYNSDLTKELREGAKIQSSADATPSKLGDTVVPVMETNPKLLRPCNNFASGSRTTTANGVTFYTVPAGKKLQINTVYISNMSDVTADNTSIFISVVDGSITSTILEIKKLSTTAFNFSTGLSFPKPLEFSSGTLVKITNIFTVGASTTAYSITGILIDLSSQ